MQTFAARRFPLPPGAALAVTTQIQTTAQNNIAEVGAWASPFYRLDREHEEHSGQTDRLAPTGDVFGH